MWERLVRVVVIAVPLTVVAVLTRLLGVPWWLIAVGVVVFVWYLLAES